MQAKNRTTMGTSSCAGSSTCSYFTRNFLGRAIIKVCSSVFSTRPLLLHISDYNDKEKLYLSIKNAVNRNDVCKILDNILLKLYNIRVSKEEGENSVDPDEVAHHELPHLGLCCFQTDLVIMENVSYIYTQAYRG